MNALKRRNRLKDLEVFQHGLEGLLRRSSVHWPEGEEEPMAQPNGRRWWTSAKMTRSI